MKTLKLLSVAGFAAVAGFIGSAAPVAAQEHSGGTRAVTTLEEETYIDDSSARVIGPESRPAPRLGFNGRIVSTGLRVESVSYDSIAFEAGLERGDVILEVNGRQMTSMAGYRRALLDAVDNRDGRVRLVIENVRYHTGESSQRYVTRVIQLPVYGGSGSSNGFDG